MSEHGLITIPSESRARETMDRLEAGVKAAGMTVFARIDHAAGAVAAGLTLSPTELLIFGNARAGTPLMQQGQVTGIDLPLKVLVWEDSGGKIWVTYNDPRWIAKRHELPDTVDRVVEAMAAGLAALARKAGSAAP